jgi:hypothetical protein
MLKKRQRENVEEENQLQESEKRSPPNFLLKLYQILETNEFNHIVEWGDNGKSFIVKNTNEFSDKVLPKFFKHNNYASFVRQVSFYLKLAKHV